MAQKKFWEAWGDTESLNAKLSIIVFCLIVVVAILGMVMARTALAPKPVYYISGEATGGIVYPGKVPDEVLKNIAENLI